MWGFNVTDQDFSYDNRPVAPLMNFTFEQWWFHGHLDYPPNDGDIFELPAGQNATAQLACNKGATDFFASSDGGDIRDPNDEQNPCPGSPISEFHTQGIDDVKGCALAIAYTDNVTSIQPEDFTVFSINQTCVWSRNTTFEVPERMPPCPAGGCTCAWFWIHSVCTHPCPYLSACPDQYSFLIARQRRRTKYACPTPPYFLLSDAPFRLHERFQMQHNRLNF